MATGAIMVGLVVSVIVTEKLQVVKLPDASVIVYDI